MRTAYIQKQIDKAMIKIERVQRCTERMGFVGFAEATKFQNESEKKLREVWDILQDLADEIGN